METLPHPDPSHPEPTTDVAVLLTATWQDIFAGAQPPADWLTHTATTLDGYIAHQINNAAAQQIAAARRVGDIATGELTRLRERIRQQFVDAVAEQRLDADLADGMLEHFGMPPLRRGYTVHIKVPMVITVTAETADDAYDTATDIVTNALSANDDVYIEWLGAEHVHAEPGEVDTENP